MLWALLADALVILHFGLTAFVVFGGFLSWGWPRATLAHLPALAWGLWIELSGSLCPLTPLENELRLRGGEAGYPGGFLAHYLHGILYPDDLTRPGQWRLAALLLGINALAYAARLRRSGRAAPRSF